eukprot:COSAG06_NODE_21892_length_738_cov_3.330218_1_plen_73_part_01
MRVSKTYALSSPDADTHTHATSPAAEQHNSVWPCHMTYDTQHLRPIGGGALSNAHTHTEGEGAASTQTASQHA